MKNSIINYDKLFSTFAVDSNNKVQDFVWFNYSDFLTTGGFNALYESFPEISFFEEHKGLKRVHQQAPHDRFILHLKNRFTTPMTILG